MRKRINLKTEIDPNNIPVHMGFIMDGNGRWAKKRGLPRTAGHRAGIDALERVSRACRNLGVKVVSVYAFSTENYKRSDEECKYIFDLVEKFVKDKLEDLIKNDTRIVVSGDLYYNDKLTDGARNTLLEAVEKTAHCKSYVLNFCFSYGGHHEIVQAVNKLIKAGAKEISAQDIENNLYVPELPMPDMIVRASGEMRLSNFLLWQSAYAELLFITEFWPDFNEEIVRKCIVEYQKRNRRFGNV